MKRIIVIFLLTSVFVSCKKTEIAVEPGTKVHTQDSSVSYLADIKQIIDAYCKNCHTENHYMDMSKYEQLKARADNGLLNEHLFVKKDMPPAGNPIPNTAEFQKIKDWIEDGCKP